ncbi:MAG: hypothetical protein NTV34_08085 [Proteobacteria bacterium]|nr:hypothetical protein [Pseudomonadota bacterium]
MHCGKHLFQSLAILAVVVLFCSCAMKKSNNDTHRDLAAPRATPAVSWNGDGVDNFAPQISSSGDAQSLLMALSGCDCAPTAAAALLTASAVKRGILPQVFVPQIRETITSDSKLQILLKLPSGLQNTLKSWLASDSKIASEIRTGISGKLNKSLGNFGGTTLSNRSAFRLDLFSAFGTDQSSFKMADQAARWNLVMGGRNLWTGGAPLDGVDHGLQLLETMRVAAEWAYIAGLSGSGKPGGFGGLALDVRTGNKNLVAPYDPTTAPKEAGLFASGVFTISYANASAVDMATKIKEKWVYQADEVTLLDQARLWRSAALAFRNFRGDLSKNASAILGVKDGALSSAMQQLPLLWLPGMGQLLEKKFINIGSRLILKTAFGAEAPADLETLLTMADAIQEWRSATSNLATSGLSPAVTEKLKGVPQKLLVPLQLTVQSIISKHTFVQDGNDVKLFVGSNGQVADPRLSAIAIRILGNLEQNGLNSEELKAKVFSLFASHAPSWAAQQAGVDAPTMIEEYRAAAMIAKYQDAQEWMRLLRDKMGASVARWGGAS